MIIPHLTEFCFTQDWTASIQLITNAGEKWRAPTRYSWLLFSPVTLNPRNFSLSSLRVCKWAWIFSWTNGNVLGGLIFILIDQSVCGGGTFSTLIKNKQINKQLTVLMTGQPSRVMTSARPRTLSHINIHGAWECFIFDLVSPLIYTNMKLGSHPWIFFHGVKQPVLEKV